MEDRLNIYRRMRDDLGGLEMMRQFVAGVVIPQSLFGLRSFVSQRDHGIDSGRLACGHKAGSQRHRGK